MLKLTFCILFIELISSNFVLAKELQNYISSAHEECFSCGKIKYEILKSEVRPLLESVNPETKKERDICHSEISPKISELLKKDFRSKGMIVVGQLDTLDPKEYRPFAWYRKMDYASIIFQEPNKPFTVVEHEEYQIYKKIFWVLSKPFYIPKKIEISIPIRQVGKVIRDKTSKTDRVEMLWMVPSTSISAVSRERHLSSGDEINHANNTATKKVFESHLGLNPTLYTLQCRPNTARLYKMRTAERIQ